MLTMARASVRILYIIVGPIASINGKNNLIPNSYAVGMLYAFTSADRCETSMLM
jgi:hypothetical protein